MVVTYILWGSIFIPRLIFRMVRWLQQFLPRKGPCAALNLADGRSNSLPGSCNWSRNTDACFYVTVEGQTVLSGFRMTVIASVFSVLSFLMLSLLCVRLTAERVSAGEVKGKIQF